MSSSEQQDSENRSVTDDDATNLEGESTAAESGDEDSQVSERSAESEFDTGATDPVEIANHAGADRLAELINNTSVNDNLVDYKGSKLNASDKAVLESIVDRMEHHFSSDNTEPHVKFSTQKLTHLAYDEKYKEKGEEPCDKFTTNIDVTYTAIPGEPKHSVVAFDNVFLDLSPKFDKAKKPTKNYGATWATVYMKKPLFGAFAASFKKSSGWPVSTHKVNIDKSQDLVGLSVNFDDDLVGNDPPHFFSVMIGKDESGRTITQLKDRGTIKSMYRDQDMRRIYRCTAFFTVSANIPVALGTTTPPMKGSLPCRVKFTLGSVRAYSVCDSIRPIKLGSVKVKSNVFGT